MTKKELREYRSIKSELQNLERLYKKVARSGDEELTEKYAVLCRRLESKLAAMERAIATLDSAERTLMRLRYIEGFSWQEISIRISYSLQHTYNLHASALNKLKDL